MKATCPSGNAAVEPDRGALLVVDLQKGEYNPEKLAQEPDLRYLFDRIRDVVIPNGQRLIAACREAGIEIIYTVVECLTRDGRDRSLDYKVSGIFVPRGSWQAEVIDELRPDADDIVIPKTSSSLFNSTNFEYVLRNLGVEYVVVMGVLTDQCVETAVRDGCDRGFLMTLVDDACATHSAHRHRERCTDSGAIVESAPPGSSSKSSRLPVAARTLELRTGSGTPPAMNHRT